MSDVLIRDVPEDVIKAVDAKAARLGLSRTQYLRRRLQQDADDSSLSVTVDHLRALSLTYADLDDGEVMSAAWR